MRYCLGMVAKPCGVVSVYLIGSGLLWDRLCRKKDELNHHPHPNTTGPFNICHAQIRLFILMFLALLMPLLAYAFKGIGETLTRAKLRGFGESGINFAVKFWVNGIDDGKTNTRLMFFIIWNTLKENDIKIPYPHRVVEFKNMLDIPEE